MKNMSSKSLNQWIGSQIYRARVAQKLSQEALAEAADVSRVFISNLENGNCSAKIYTYYRIACALNISLPELFSRNEDIRSVDEILFLLSDCPDDEMRAYIEILRVVKTQYATLRNSSSQ